MFLNSTAHLPYSQPVHVNNSFTREIRGPLKGLGLLTVLPEPFVMRCSEKGAWGGAGWSLIAKVVFQVPAKRREASLISSRCLFRTNIPKNIIIVYH